MDNGKKYDLLVKGGLVVGAQAVRPLDVGIRDGKIVETDRDLPVHLAD